MGNQGMKIWKLSTFFVIGLMLMAGLFTNTASAQSASVSVVPNTVIAEAVIPTLTVTYTVANGANFADGANTIDIILPAPTNLDRSLTNWGPAYNAFDATAGDLGVGMDSPSFGGDVIGDVATDMKPTGDAAKMTSYVTLFSSVLASGLEINSASVSTNMVSVTIARVSGNTAALLANGNKIVIVYHNVKVQDFPIVRENRDGDIVLEDLPATKKLDESSQVTVMLSVMDSAVVDSAPDDEPTDPVITVNRLGMGEVTIPKPSVTTAGSTRDLTISYEVTEEILEGFIEIRLPDGWADNLPPRLFDESKSPASGVNKDDVTAELIEAHTTGAPTGETRGYVYLTANSLRLTARILEAANSLGTVTVDAEGEVLDDEYEVTTPLMVDGANIIIAVKGAKKGNVIKFEYKGAPAQRGMATGMDAAVFEVYSDLDDTAFDAGDVVADQASSAIPQHAPTNGQPTVVVNPAANGSGMMMVQFKGGAYPDYTDFGSDDNTDLSIPAGSVADDEYHLRFTFTPVGGMAGGMLRLEIPTGSGWGVTEVDAAWDSSNTGTVDSSNPRAVVATFPEGFGSAAGDSLEIDLLSVSTPNRHVNYEFTTKSSSSGSPAELPSLMQPQVLVGNILADKDTGTVEIKPAAVYEGEEGRNFEITFTANGPMYASEIMITVPAGIADTDNPQTGTPNTATAGNGYVRKTSVNARDVMVSATGSDSDITIEVGEINEGGKVTVTYNKVDIPAGAAGGSFVVSTRTRTSAADGKFTEDFMEISGTADAPAVTGGAIRAIAGSGTMATSRMTVEKGSGNNTFTLTYKAATALKDATLVIMRPDAVETDFSDSSAKEGYVSTPDGDSLSPASGTEELKVDSNTITWSGLTLDADATFKTVIRKVSISELTGSFEWDATLNTGAIEDDPDAEGDEVAMLVVVGKSNDVAFEIVDPTNDNPITTPYYSAASKHVIGFRFTATNTPIEDGGSFWFTVPGSWSTPDLADTKGKARVGIVTDDGSLAEKVKDGAKTDDDDGWVLKRAGNRLTVTIGPEGLREGEGITIQYGTLDYLAEVQSTKAGTPDSDEDGVRIRGFFKAGKNLGQRDAGSVFVDIENVADGAGTATIVTDPAVTRAGSKNNKIVVVYTGAGTMDGGAVQLDIPGDWGAVQDDSLLLNYISVSPPSVLVADDDDNDPIVISNDGFTVTAHLKKFGDGSKLTFIYGGGTGGDDTRGAEAQDDISDAEFSIQSDGDGDGIFELVDGVPHSESNPEGDPAGVVYDDEKGGLTVEVKGSESGTGEVTVETVKSGTGEGLYDGDTDDDEKKYQVHAGGDKIYLLFTYQPEQTIGDGKLEFIVPGVWTAPQDGTTGEPGYTYLESTGAAQVGNIEYNTTKKTITADITVEQDDTILIHYGWYETEDGGAVAQPTVTNDAGFAIKIKGNPDDDAQAIPVPAVQVRPQASGGGTAAVEDPGVVNSGDTGRDFTITYTATGEVRVGTLKLTVPDNWPVPMAMNVEVSSTGSIEAAADIQRGGDYETADLPEGVTAKDVVVEGVDLEEGETVTFAYSDVAVQTAMGDAKFTIAFDGGDGPDTGVQMVAEPIVTVGEAAAGSGMGMVSADSIKAGDIGVNITFTYTAVGDVTSRREFRITVPEPWSAPIKDAAAADKKGTYTVTHERDGSTYTNTVERIDPIGRQMVARVKLGTLNVMAGDEIIFEYQNADAPTEAGSSTFRMEFAGQSIADSPKVVVSDTEASMLVVNAPAAVSGDAEADSVRVTVMIQDAGGNAATVDSDLVVTLATSNTATGSFSDADGEAVEMVTISDGTSSEMVYYSDSGIGTTATITASANGLADGEDTIMVGTDVDTIDEDSIMAAPAMAVEGDTVTITVEGTSGRTAQFSIGSIISDIAMSESPSGSGSYTGSTMPIVLDLQDGTHDVTIVIGEVTATAEDAVTIDTTAPTVTASASPPTVANGEDVTISAVVTGDATSVMANVSMLDIAADPAEVELTDADADGTYTGAHTISTKNGADNGTHTITVTAMDAAGNSSDPATAMVTLQNTLSFTSTIPAGISLFHVPLDVEGLDTVGDLEAKLGDNVNLLITYDGTSWNSRSDDVMITATLGILVSLSAETMVTFEGNAWADSSVTLAAGSNLIGLPVNDPNVTMISDIIGLFSANTVSSVIVASGGEFQAVAAAGDAADGPVAGDAAYLVVATAAGSAMLSGDGWMNGNASAAPIALAGYTVDNQTPVLDVHGSVVDEITGLAREGFRVKVKNLSTKAALSNITSAEAAEGYNIIFVDLADSYAARVGDVLEISAETPDPLLGIKPVRHIVTVDDVKNSRIQLEDLIAYEIPAETELLRNYPNPFNPETWIPYRLAEDADVSLTIYDTSGALVRSIDIGHQTAAVYETRAKAIYWDGRNQFGEQVASGLYFYHLSAGDDFSGTRRMVILK